MRFAPSKTFRGLFAQNPGLVGSYAVGLLAFAAYVFCATPAPYPLDSAELATAAFGLGIAHPPGEETTLLLGKLFTLLPLGSVAFKVALCQAAAGAVAAVLVYLLLLGVAGRMEVVVAGTGQGTRVLVAAAAALAFAFAPGVIIVSARPEVYATQTALSLGALLLAVRAHAAAEPRLVLLAALLIGLGVGNHSLIAGLVGLGSVTAALPWLTRQRAGGAAAMNRVPGKWRPGRFVGLALAAFATGLLVHAYIPLRTSALFAAGDGGVDNVLWGDGRTAGGFWWVVSARIFAQKTGIVHGNASPWDLPFLPIEELTMVFALMAVAGAYFVLRRRETRLAGIALLVGAAGSMGAGLIGGLDPGNPDIRGYLGAAFALIAVGSGIAIAVGTALFRPRPMRVVLAIVFLFASLTRFPSPAKYPGLRHAHAADREVRGLLHGLPARAALFTHHFETAFLVGYERYVEGARPDVAWAHLPFAPNPSYAARVRAARPELAGIIDSYRGHGALSAAWLALDASHPVRVEPDMVTLARVHSPMVPCGQLWCPLGARAAPEAWPPLDAAALAEAAQDRQVRGYLSWRRYTDATHSCRRGFRERAGERFRELDELVPDDEKLRELRQRCDHGL